MIETSPPSPVPGRRLRDWAVQALVLFGLVALAGLAARMAADNLARQGIASGFGFLRVAAGFDIIMHLIDYNESSSYGRVFLVGLINTLVLTGVAIIGATVLGLMVGLARASNNWMASKIASVYIELFRNIPVLLQVFFWYFAVLRALPGPRNSLDFAGLIYLNNRGLYGPAQGSGSGLALAAVIVAGLIGLWLGRHLGGRRGAWAGLVLGVLGAAGAVAAGGGVGPWETPRLGRFGLSGGLVLIPEFVAMVMALTIYGSAYIAELVRAGLDGVDRGQWEAGRALGLGRGPLMRFVVLPQALRLIVPPLTSQYLDVLKNSTLATAVAYPDLMSVFGGTVLNQTGQAIEVLAITMAVYLTISLSISAAMNLYNRRLAWAGGGGR